MKTALKNVSLLLALLAVVYIVANYGGIVKSQALSLLHISDTDVKGASTEKAKELSGQFTADITTELGILQEQMLNLSVSDAINGFSRLQKISKDFTTVTTFTKEQISSLTKKKQK